MGVRRFLAAFVFTGATLIAAGSAPAAGLDLIGVWDAPSRYFPGKYFEQKAQFYLQKNDYATALRLFELSGYWADKVAQYNVGIMHFNGIGVPVDKVLGAAWLGIAAEAHGDLADLALQAAYAEMTPEQRIQADAAFRVLDEKYGDGVTLERALRRYQQDAAISLFGFGVTGPGYVNTCAGAAGCIDETSVSFVRRMDAQRSALIAQITGHVGVGSVQPLPVPAAAKRNASQTPLNPATGNP